MTEHGHRLSKRYEATRCRTWFGGRDGLSGQQSQSIDLITQPSDFGLESHHPTNSLDVHTIRREFSNATKTCNISFAVTPITTAGARRLKKSASFVDAERLRMHTGQFGSYRDHVNGSIAFGHFRSPSVPIQVLPDIGR